MSNNARLQCNNEECPGRDVWEPSFVMHTYHIEEHDYHLDSDGSVGDHIADSEEYDGRATGVIHGVRCQHCNKDVEVPQDWYNRNPAMWDPDLQISWAIRQDRRIPENVAGGKWKK